MMNKLKLYIFGTLALLTLGSCGKNSAVMDCTFYVKPYIQLTKEDTLSVSVNVKGYYFNTDTTSYKIESYEQAIKGELTSRKGGSPISFSGEAVLNEDSTVSFNNLTHNTVVMVLYDEDQKMYAWRQTDMEAGLDRIYTRLYFRPWKKNEKTGVGEEAKPLEFYRETGWTIEWPDPVLP